MEPLLLLTPCNKKTAVLAFPNKPILVHYDLGEFGGVVGSRSSRCSASKKQQVLPENIPRPIEIVVRELEEQCQQLGVERWNPLLLDTTSLRPPHWPTSRHIEAPAVVKRDKVRKFVRDFLACRPESVVAVVAHSKVIQAALSVSSTPCYYHRSNNGTPGSHTRRGGHQVAAPRKEEEQDGNSGNPRNAVPIACRLTDGGIQRIEAPRSTPQHAAKDGTTIQPIVDCDGSLPSRGTSMSPTLDDDEKAVVAGRIVLPNPISLASRLEDEVR
jgi:hypothetical protein